MSLAVTFYPFVCLFDRPNTSEHNEAILLLLLTQGLFFLTTVINSDTEKEKEGILRPGI